MKKIFLTLYFVFDFLMSLFPIAFFVWRAFEKRTARLVAGNWSIMYFLALYLLLTSVVGIVLSKKEKSGRRKPDRFKKLAFADLHRERYRCFFLDVSVLHRVRLSFPKAV